MSLHESRRSPARRTDDIQLLQGLLTQRLYVNEHDRRPPRVLLAETPRQLPPAHATRRRARRLRAGGAALALSGALALAFGSPLLTAVAASSTPTTWIAVTDRAADNLAPAADDALLRALLNHVATASQVVAPADQAAPPASDALLRALLNRTATANQTVAPADQAAPSASDALLRALLNRTATANQTVASAEQTVPKTDEALAQAELIAGETLVIPAAQATINTIVAAPADSTQQQAIRYYVVQPGDTLSGIAQYYYGDGNLWPTIFNANTDKIANPHWIYPNQQLVIPTTGITAVANPPSITAFAMPNTATVNYNRGLGQYTVRSGDTLSGIAAYAYGKRASWWGIYQANSGQICDPDLIFPGQVLTIP